MPYVIWCQVLGFKEKDEKKLQTTEIKVLRMICGKTLRDCKKNATICKVTDAEKTEKFFKEQRLRWFGLMKRINDERTPVKAKSFVVDDSKRGRPKKR